MTVATVATVAVGGVGRRGLLVAQTGALSRRSIRALLREPALVVPSMIFPLVFVALGSSAFSRTTALEGFPPVDSFLDFALAGAIVQGVLFGSVASATTLATDIENGFFDRLLAAPTSRPAILISRLTGAMTFGAAQALFFCAALLPFGLGIRAGLAGVLVMAAGGMLTALAVGGIMSAMALRTGSSEAVQGSFPLLFILLFFSSAFFPRQLMRGTYATIADINPISHLVEGFRGLVIDGLEWGYIARTLGISGCLAVLTVAIAARSLNRRIAAA